jgi:hypothetical protein
MCEALGAKMGGAKVQCQKFLEILNATGTILSAWDHRDDTQQRLPECGAAEGGILSK